jgi:hypothetical protein
MPSTTHDLMCHPFHHMTKDEIAQAIKVRTARLNAQKSSGPRTPEGKAISARNAFKHGFAGASLTIDPSEREPFNAHLDAYFSRFKPQDQVEADTVRRIAEAQWKMDTINAAESAIMELEGGWQMCLADAKLDPNQVTIHHHRAFAIIEQSEGSALDLCHRYHVQASRAYDRALRTFYKLRDERLNDAKDEPVPEALIPAGESDPPPHRPHRIHLEIVKKPNEPTAATAEPPAPSHSDTKETPRINSTPRHILAAKEITPKSPQSDDECL